MSRGICLLFFALVTSLAGFAQTTTVSTESSSGFNGGNGVSGSSSVTFVIENTNAFDIVLKQVDAFWQTANNNAVPTLWYSASSLSGAPTISSPTWTSIATGSAISVPANGYYPALTNLSFIIPANTQYRFALQSTAGVRYSGSGTAGSPSPNVFSGGGVNLKVYDAKISAANVGYGGTFPSPTNNPRGFTGRIIFEPSAACVAPPTAGTAVSSSSTACAGSSFTLSLTGSSSGTGLTYQWQSSPNNSAFTNISGATSSTLSTTQSVTTYYRAQVTCSGQTSTSSSVLVTTPAALSGSSPVTYTIDASIPASSTNYQSFTNAINALNCGGIGTGAVTFNVSAGQTFNEDVPAITASGTSGARITFQKSGVGANPVIQPTGTSATGEAGIAIAGGDYITFDGIDINSLASTVEYGYAIRNTSTSGATNNIITNARITLNSSTPTVVTATIGVIQTSSTTGGGVAATSNSNINQSNTFNNLTIENAYSGMLFISGGTNNYDNNTTVSNNTIGSAAANSIGNTTSTTLTYGIKATLQNAIQIFGNTIQNVSGGSTLDGIFLDRTYGTSNVYRNTIANLTRMGTTSTTVISGIRLDFSTLVASHVTNVYNNVITGLQNNYTGATTPATRRMIGINILSSTASGTYNISYNSVRIAPAAAYSSSSTAFQVDVNAPVINVRNNIFANFNSAPTGTGRHYAYVTTSATTTGPAGSVSDYNDIYVSDVTKGAAVLAGTTEYTLAAWKAFLTPSGGSTPEQEANSYSVDPEFTSSTNLRIPAGTTSPLESGGIFIAALGNPNTDITGAARPNGPASASANSAPDIGAYEFNGVIVGDSDAPVISNVAGSPTGNQCTASSRTITATVTDATGAASVQIIYTVNGVSQTPITMTRTSGTATNGTYSGTIPAQGSNTVVYSISATDSAPTPNVASTTNTTYQDAVLTIGFTASASPALVNSGDQITLTASAPILNGVRMSEITLFRTGTGQTTTYPSYIGGSDNDFVEFTNLTGANANIGGYIFEVVGTGARTYTFPANTTIPANGVLVLHVGTGTDVPASRYYNTGGTTDGLSSGSNSGFILRAPNNSVLDAVALNTYTFAAGSGVTSADWSGSASSPSGAAGTVLINTDNNTGANWSPSTTTTQTIGTRNSGLTNVTVSTVSWTGPNGFTATGNPVTATAPATSGNHDYIASITDGTCTATATATVNVCAIPANPTTTSASRCGAGVVNLSASGAADLRWYTAATGGTLVNTGATFSPSITATTTYYVESFNGQCSSSRVAVTGTVNAVPGLAVMPATQTINQGTTATLSAELADLSVRMSEITLFGDGGTGQTPTYPTGISGSDFVEFTNLSNATANISGYILEVVGTGARTYTFPANTTIPANAVLVLHLGSGTDNTSIRYYHTGGTESLSSGSNSGFILRAPNNSVLDAVALNTYTFAAGSGVTSADWSGSASSPSGAAGTVLINTDNNTGANWSPSTTTTQSIGTRNSGLTNVVAPGTISWTGPNGFTATGNPITTPVMNTTGTFTYTATYTATNGCSASASGDVVVNPPVTPVAAFSADNTTPTTGGITSTVTFTDQSTNIPASWMWTFSPNTVMFVGGTSATSQNPQVQFNAAGQYTVSLVASNSAGSDTETKVNYITVTLGYCASNATGTTNADIGNVTFGSLNNGTATPVSSNPAATQTYTDFTGMAATAIQKQLATSISVGIITSSATLSTTNVNVFIDYDQNGVFDLPAERVYSGTATTDPTMRTVTGTVVIPSTALMGITRMRVVATQTSTTALPACGTYTSGETEDYRINITAAPSCVAPTGLSATNINISSATLNWSAASGAASGYFVRYKKASDPTTVSTWATPKGTSGTNTTITGLSSGTAYEFQVQSRCSSTSLSAYSATGTFNTLIAGGLCGTAQPITFSPNFNSGSLTTCGAGDDYGIPAGTTLYGPGEDYVFSLTTTAANRAYQFNLAGTSTYKSLTAYMGCPSPANAPANMIGSQIRTSTGTTGTVIISFPTAGTYYIVIDHRPAPTCGNFTLEVIPLADLVVSTNQNISGSYNSVTVMNGATATVTGALFANSLTVRDGATLVTGTQTLTGTAFTLEAGGTLTIGNLAAGISAAPTATGNIQHTTRSFSNDAIYVYNGAGAQITGTGLPSKVRSLTVNKTTGALTLTNPLSISRMLTLTQGNLTLGTRALTLLSDANGTAMVVNTNGVVTGTATVQRNVTVNPLAPSTSYKHYSSPVANATISDLATSSGNPLIVNPAYNTAPVPGLVRPFPTVFAFQESRLATSDTAADGSGFTGAFISPNSLSDVLTPGRGYSVLKNRATLDLNGTLNNGAVSVGTLTHSGATVGGNAGWHLLGNPYPSPIDWDNVTIPAGMDNAMYAFQSDSRYYGTYRAYVKGGPQVSGLPTLAGGIIPAMQGFFVRVNAPTAFSFQNAHRVTTYENPTFYRTGAEERPVVQLDLVNKAGFADAMLVYVQQGATMNADSEFDAYKLKSAETGTPNLYAVTPARQELSISGIPSLNDNVVIPLGAEVGHAGIYTFRAEQLLNIPAGAQVLLEDRLKGTVTALSKGSELTVELKVGKNADRFALRITPAGKAGVAKGLEQASVYPNPTDNSKGFTLQLNGMKGKAVSIQLYNAIGKLVEARTVTPNADLATAAFTTANLAKGVYTIRLTDGAQTIAKKVVVQ